MEAELLRLLQLTDPTLPIGGYAHSYGLETYVQAGVVTGAATAKAFVVAMLEHSIHYTDAAFVALAYDAAAASDWEKIVELSDEYTAVKLCSEPRLASQKLGLRLIKIFGTFSNAHMVLQYKEATGKFLNPHYSIAFGLFAQALGVGKKAALTGFYYNAAVGLITNCVKLIPLGQQDGQVLLFSLQPLLTGLTQRSMQPDVDKIGLCCAGFDVRSMQHERLYSRLYMS